MYDEVGSIFLSGNKLSHRKTNSNGKRIKAKSKRLKKMLGKGVSKVKNVAEAQVERAVQKVKQAKGEGNNRFYS